MTGEKNYLTEETDENGQRYSKPHLAKSIAETLWDYMDESTERIITKTAIDESLEKVRGRTFAIAVHLMMRPYYEDVDAVIRQSVKRIKMKRGEISWEPTPGYDYNPPPPGSDVYKKYAQQNASSTRTIKQAQPKSTVRTRVQASKQLTADETASIKNALQSGLFSAADLARVYGVTLSTVEKLR